MRNIKKITILGVGFMGGSLAVALREKFPKITICGYARSKKVFVRLKKLKVLDRVEQALDKCLRDADMVALALPVGVIVDSFKKISPFLKKGAIVFDLGSSKSAIEKAADKYLPKNVNFVGCHPLCGGEKTGAEFVNYDLYKGSLCLVTSSKNKAAKIVENLWNSLGCEVVFMNSQRHDRILSSVSHLPHLISFSFADSILKGYERFGSTSFKDLTRISASSAFIWADIFLSNKRNILFDLNRFTKVLNKFEGLLKKQDKKGIINLITKINSKQKYMS